MDYRLFIYRLPASREDEIAARLWQLGTLGMEVKADPEPGFVRLEAYFPEGPSFAEEVDAWDEPGVERLDRSRPVEDRDWLAEYRARARPFEVGSRFLVVPGEPDAPLPELPAGRLLLRVPAQNAFGTGSHESTRLALGRLESLDLRGKTLLDVGVGSGILSFAALKLGAAKAVGFDLDAPSVVTAAAGGARNDARPVLFAGTAAALGPVPCFDLLLVNVLPERVWDDYPRLLRCLAPGGSVISSGNLLERRDELLARFRELGLRSADGRAGETSEGEWTSFHLVRA